MSSVIMGIIFGSSILDSGMLAAVLLTVSSVTLAVTLKDILERNIKES